MTDLPDDANERIAEACGFTIYDKSGRKVSVDEYGDSCNRFDPATDPAAALFALEAYAKKNSLAYAIHGGVNQSFNVGFYGRSLPTTVREFYVTSDSLCQAICRAILQAEKERKSCQ